MILKIETTNEIMVEIIVFLIDASALTSVLEVSRKLGVVVDLVLNLICRMDRP